MKKAIIICAILASHFAIAQKVTFGVISDVHQDLQKDAIQRLDMFLKDAEKKNPDFIIQLGDLSHSTGADEILKNWNKYPGDKYSVFGNHDMDNADKATMIAKYNMPGSYYSFDNGGVHFIVLDCCFTRKDGKIIDYNHGNYYVKSADRDIISEQQLEWLAKDLASTDKKCVIFSHQALDEIGGSVPNREAFRAIVHQANKEEKKVVGVFCGHHHIDAYSEIDGIGYFQINSASYLWVEGKKKYSNGNMAEYADPLYAFATINLKSGTIIVKGRQSKFLAPAPTAEDFPATEWEYINPGIKDRKVKW